MSLLPKSNFRRRRGDIDPASSGAGEETTKDPQRQRTVVLLPSSKKKLPSRVQQQKQRSVPSPRSIGTNGFRSTRTNVVTKVPTSFAGTSDSSICLYWHRPLGSPQHTRRLSLECNGGSKRSATYWALPLQSAHELLEHIQLEATTSTSLLTPQTPKKKFHCHVLELDGSKEAWDLLEDATWLRILQTLSQHHATIYGLVFFGNGCCDHQRCVALRHFADFGRRRQQQQPLQQFQLIYPRPDESCTNTLRQLTAMSDGTGRGGVAHSHDWRDVTIVHAPVLSVEDCRALQRIIQSSLRSLTLQSTKIVSLEGWFHLFHALEESSTIEQIQLDESSFWTLMQNEKDVDDEEHGSKATFSYRHCLQDSILRNTLTLSNLRSDSENNSGSLGGKNGDSKVLPSPISASFLSSQSPLTSYLEWNGRLNQLRREWIQSERKRHDYVVMQQEQQNRFRSCGLISTATNSAATKLWSRSAESQLLNERIDMLESACVVLKQWYRSTHCPLVPVPHGVAAATTLKPSSASNNPAVITSNATNRNETKTQGNRSFAGTQTNLKQEKCKAEA